MLHKIPQLSSLWIKSCKALVLAFAVFQLDLKECKRGPLFEGTLSTGYQRLISEQRQYKQQTKLIFSWALCPRKRATHELTPWGKEKGEKSSKNKMRREKGRLKGWLHTDWPPTWMWETKPEKIFPRLAQEMSSNLLSYLENSVRDQELWLYGEKRWLRFMNKIK